MMTKTLPATLETLLTDLVDYAGLFPPAGLGMPAAVDAYARHRRGPQAFMLGRFVVPASRLEALAKALERVADDGEPWPLSVLTGDDLELARTHIDRFVTHHGARAQPRAIEMRADRASPIARAAKLFGALERFVEIPHSQRPEPLMAVLATHASRAKIRTGGVVADAFPSAFELARFITAAARAGVGMKATAGLHHPLCGRYPLTYERGSEHGQMFGFLNVFLAAALADEGLRDPEALVPLLEMQTASGLELEEQALRVGEHTVGVARLRHARSHFARSFGSCSFREPVEGLQALGLVPPS